MKNTLLSDYIRDCSIVKYGKATYDSFDSVETNHTAASIIHVLAISPNKIQADSVCPNSSRLKRGIFIIKLGRLQNLKA